MHTLSRFVTAGTLLLMLALGCRVPALAQTASRSGLALAQQLDTIQDTHPEAFFELLATTYPAAEQPVPVSRVFQDYRTNPYLGEKARQLYNVLISRPAFQELYAAAPPTVLVALNAHLDAVEVRYKALTSLRLAVKQLLIKSTVSQLIALWRQFRPDAPTDDEIRIEQNLDYQAVVRSKLLVGVLARFEVVANGPSRLQERETKALEATTAYGINQLFTALEQQDAQVKITYDAVQALPLKSTEKATRDIASLLNFDPRISLTFARQNAGLIPAAIPQPAATGSAESAVLDALARFVAKRMKQELQAAFFERFNALLHDSSYVEMRVLFPNTTRLITRGSVDYSAIIQLLRNSFEQDLQQLLFNLNHLLVNRRYAGLLNPPGTPSADQQRLAQALRYTHVALVVLEDLQKGTHPRTIIARLDQQLQTTSGFPPHVREAAQVLNILSESFLTDSNLTEVWANAAQVEALLKPANVGQLRCFLGVLHQRLLRVEVALPVLAAGNQLQQVAFGFASISSSMQEQLDQLRKKLSAAEAANRPQPEDYARLYQLALTLTSFATEYVLDESLAQVQQAEAISQAIMEGYQAALRGNYGLTVSNLLEILNITMPHEEFRNRSQLLRYAPFMAAVAEAKDPRQIEQAIEAIALPAGSASVKRKTFSSITLNAFPGVMGGREFIYLPGSGASHARGAWATNLGFTAPIGLSFSRGVRGIVLQPKTYHQRAIGLRVEQNYHYYNRRGREHYLKGRASSIFVSLLDIGALVLFRLNDSLNASPLPQTVTLRQVFAPGLFYMYHTGRSPVSFFGGVALSPELRRLTASAGQPETAAANSVRVNVGITIDVPLLTFYARSERRQSNLDSSAVARERRKDLDATTQYFRSLRDKQDADPKATMPSTAKYERLKRRLERTQDDLKRVPLQ